jgi:hypothetical protein
MVIFDNVIRKTTFTRQYVANQFDQIVGILASSGLCENANVKYMKTYINDMPEQESILEALPSFVNQFKLFVLE